MAFVPNRLVDVADPLPNVGFPPKILATPPVPEAPIPAAELPPAPKIDLAVLPPKMFEGFWAC